MVFFGPAYPDSIQFFNPPTTGAPIKPQELNPEMLFTGMNTVAEGSRTETWRQRYLASRYRQEFVANRSGKQQATDKAGSEKPRREFGSRPMAGAGQAQRHRPPAGQGADRHSAGPGAALRRAGHAGQLPATRQPL